MNKESITDAIDKVHQEYQTFEQSNCEKNTCENTQDLSEINQFSRIATKNDSQNEVHFSQDTPRDSHNFSNQLHRNDNLFDTISALRVRKNITNGYKDILYRGVTVNSWFNPYGITNLQPMGTTRALSARQRTSEDKSQRARLTPECQQTIEARARSAGVLGRQSFEEDPNDIIKCVSLEPPVVIDRSDDIEAQQRHQDLLLRLGRQGRHKGDYKRPHTAPPCVKPPKPQLPQLPGIFIKPLNAPNHNYLPKSETDLRKGIKSAMKRPDLSLGTIDVRLKPKVTFNNSATYRSIQAMKEAYRMRIKEDPFDQQIQINCRRTQPSDLQRQEKPKHYKQKIPDKEKDDRGKLKDNFQGLKPLMYDDDLELVHEDGCPYNCRGCFRACLASDAYFDKMESRLKQEVKKQTKKKRVTIKDPVTNREHRDFPDQQYLFRLQKFFGDDFEIPTAIKTDMSICTNYGV